MNILLIAVAITCGTLFWVLNRWAVGHGARPQAYSFWMFAAGSVLSGLVAVLAGERIVQLHLWSVGAIVGLAFAGCLVLIQYCLRIGPAGPTVAMNNMGLIWPVLAGVVWLRPRVPSPGLVAGLLAVCIALAALGLSPSRGRAHAEGAAPVPRAASRRWIRAAFVLWVLAGGSMTGQAFGAIHFADSPVALCFAFHLIAALVFLPAFLRLRGAKARAHELMPGVATGLVSALAVVTVLMAIARVGSEIVFPLVVATPIIIVLLLGRFVLHERLSRLAWGGCALGTAGVVLLALS